MSERVISTRFDGLLPPSAVVVEADEVMWQNGLFAEEKALIAGSVPKRIREFTAGRNCMRKALRLMGYPEVSIGMGPNREPLLPSGLMGTITHTDVYCAAAISHVTQGLSIGIDAEPSLVLGSELVDLIVGPNEKHQLHQLRYDFPGIPWCRVMFSAKEAFYKAFFGVFPIMLDFLDIEIIISPGDSTFSIRLPELDAAAGDQILGGYFKCSGSLVVTTSAIRIRL